MSDAVTILSPKSAVTQVGQRRTLTAIAGADLLAKIIQEGSASVAASGSDALNSIASAKTDATGAVTTLRDGALASIATARTDATGAIVTFRDASLGAIDDRRNQGLSLLDGRRNDNLALLDVRKDLILGEINPKAEQVEADRAAVAADRVQTGLDRAAAVAAAASISGIVIPRDELGISENKQSLVEPLAYAVSDAAGNTPAGIDGDGAWFAQKLKALGGGLATDLIEMGADAVHSLGPGALIDMNGVQMVAVETNYTGLVVCDENGNVMSGWLDGTYYSPASQVVDGDPPATAVEYLLFGDSITETATVVVSPPSYTEGTRSNWPTYAMPALQATAFYNYAEGGASYRDKPIVDSDFDHISYQITRAMADARTPKVIITAGGANDLNVNLGSYATAMGKATLASLDRTLLYEALRWAYWSIRTQWPNAICFAVLPIQRAGFRLADHEPMRTAIRLMAEEYGFDVIDAGARSGIVSDFEVIGGAGRHLSDGIHPITTGQQAMSNLIVSVVRARLIQE